MRLTSHELEQLAERAYREQVQREFDAEQDGREVGKSGGHAGLMPDYQSKGERKAWLRGWLAMNSTRRIP
jgi:ribosome modulation factor